MARALWHIAPGKSETQVETLLPVREGYARVETWYSGISRGTERLVLNGLVPQSEWERMRAPLQQGAFSFPLKYGYSAAGRVVEGPGDLEGRTVFCLHPHQDQFIVTTDCLTLVPESVPARRATLAGNAETALNAIWDSGISAGDRIAVVGAGVVGLLVASFAARLPGTDVTLVDTNPDRRIVAEALGVAFAAPDAAPRDCDCVFHTSANGAGLMTALSLAGEEATIVEMSWYGDQEISVGLGGAFHSKRLTLISSQVGQLPPLRRARWNYARRMAVAIGMLDDPRLDSLVKNSIAFDMVSAQMPDIVDKENLELPPVIRYANAVE